MVQGEKNYGRILILLGFFGLLFVYFMKPLSPVTDFWWHLATGRWIVEHRALPLADPFLFTSPPVLDYRGETILKGYWLAQVLYYGIVSLPFGWWLMVVCESLSFVFIYLILYDFLSRRLPLEVCFAILLLVVFVTNNFIEVRPQVFTFLLLALILFLLDKLESSGGKTNYSKNGIIYLPLIMLLWANLHPGVIVGFGIIAIYTMGIYFEKFFRNKNIDNKLIIILMISSACSFISPNNIRVIILMFKEKNLGGAEIANSINEYMSPWNYYPIYSYKYGFYVLTALAMISLVILIKRNNYVSVFHKIIFVVFMFMAFYSFRYVFLFLIVATFVSSHCFGEFNLSANKYVTLLSVAIIISMSVFMVMKISKRNIYHIGPLSDSGLADAAAVVIDKNINGNLFNSYEYGGYLIWKFYPEYKLFTDARTLSEETYNAYREIILGKKSTGFEKYNINSAVVSARVQAASMDRIPSINFSLLRDDAWELEYFNDEVLVFQKNTNISFAKKQFKAQYIDNLISKYLLLSKSYPKLDYFLTLGELWYVKGDKTQARFFFKEANRVAPEDEISLKWLAYLK